MNGIPLPCQQPVIIFWFRRDLRLDDNAGLFHALKQGIPVIPLFIFDRKILDDLDDKADRRVQFIHQKVTALHNQLKHMQVPFVVRYGFPEQVFNELPGEFNIKAVFANHDYEPYGMHRDGLITSLLAAKGISFRTFKDQVVFEKQEILTATGHPYSVFTPYAAKWKSQIMEQHLEPYDTEKYFAHFLKAPGESVPSMESMHFVPSPSGFPAAEINEERIRQYAEHRDFPAMDATSRLGVHLRFGTISIRMLISKAMQYSGTFLNELIWREFYQMILWNFPHIGKGRAFRPAYDHIPWKNDESDFEKWKSGQTGYPLVDAGMRELMETGFMHNRVRMVVASFLSKHLLIDWRWGEAWFAEKLLDYEMASNNGGWQWASGSGCDAAPYFRIFNPALQAKKFDPGSGYIKKWVPEYMSPAYMPMIEHEFARKRCLEVYSKALSKNNI